MQRLLILFLMFLLPLQVFAGGLDTHIGFTHQAHSSQASDQTAALQQQFPVAADPVALGNSAGDDDGLCGDDTTGFNLHVDAGDEPVPAHGFNFTPDLASRAPAQSNDNALEPPFLPLIAPPPRA
jgi:hypothetical protein